MSEDDSALTGQAQSDYLLRREAVRRASGGSAATSPPAVEATLASISAEVMQEAIARRDRVAASKGPKPRGE